MAAMAFLWLRRENSSACSRVMPYFFAKFSAVKPMSEISVRDSDPSARDLGNFVAAHGNQAHGFGAARDDDFGLPPDMMRSAASAMA